MGEYVKEELDNRKPKATENGTPSLANGSHEDQSSGVEGERAKTSAENKEEPVVETTDQEHVDISNFSLALNPDVFCGQVPQTDEEKEEWAKDEREVRTVGEFLYNKVIPDMVSCSSRHNLHI